MIVFNNVKFAKNTDEFCNSLFATGGTCSGFYKKLKNGVRLYNIQNELIGYIRFHDAFLMSATLTDDNKIWYSYASSTLEKLLNINSYPDNVFWSREVVMQLKH